ncbi:MAG: MFS transporter, partial [Clostridia bacterium]|nr:MFS transporter [Clostridia bacterium]
VLALIGDDNWRWIPLGWAMIPFFNLFNFMRVPIVEVSEEQKKSGIGTFLKSPIFLVALFMMICGGASEQAMAQWASLFAERALGVSKVLGDLLGPCLFALCMGIGRTGYGIFGEKINIEKALFACAGISVVCYLVTVFVPVPVISLLGCAFCGFGVSLMWPGVLSYTSQKYNYNAGPVLFSLLALGGDTGCSLGPWLTGMVSDLYLHTAGGGADVESQAIRYGILAAIVFPAVMLVLIGIMKKLRTDDKTSV